MRQHFSRVKDRVSLSRSSGETLVVRSTKSPHHSSIHSNIHSNIHPNTLSPNSPNQQHSPLQIQPGKPGGNDHLSVPERDPVRSSGQKINFPQNLQALRIRGIKHRHLTIATVGENDL